MNTPLHLVVGALPARTASSHVRTVWRLVTRATECASAGQDAPPGGVWGRLSHPCERLALTPQTCLSSTDTGPPSSNSPPRRPLFVPHSGHRRLGTVHATQTTVPKRWDEAGSTAPLPPPSSPSFPTRAGQVPPLLSPPLLDPTCPATRTRARRLPWSPRVAICDTARQHPRPCLPVAALSRGRSIRVFGKAWTVARVPGNPSHTHPLRQADRPGGTPDAGRWFGTSALGVAGD